MKQRVSEPAQPSRPILNAEASGTGEERVDATSIRTMHEQVAHVLELMRPAIQSDGGDVELVDISEAGTVRIRLHGACVGCPSAMVTLKAGIERNLKTRVQGVQTVEAVA